ncbi:Efflux pump membrane transporter BepE [Polystyrenella longa]|uniref:Efflux pump membrane transporter BepE n=1 Tax=Polystyrenella longa TaxID=2528007 RepID=A0A518CT29_9PLAN|nr:efflux RND transporter permease subunit [Polystyrenella longa]QDU82365.1 Efflux pump membrane transporter BepE [Polystyrenella longa]
MSLPSFSVRNSVLVNMLMIVVLVAGAFFSLSLVREMFPEVRASKLMIQAVYPGVQPEEIQKTVTIKFEEKVKDIEGIEKIESTVSEGFSLTVLTLFNEVDDINAVLDEVKNELDSIPDIPQDVEKTVRKFEPKLPVISIAVYGDGTESDRKQAVRDIKDELRQLPGVSEIELEGIRDDEISVEIRPERLLEYNITFEEIATAIGRSNLDVSGGQLKGDRASVAVRTIGEETRGRDIEDLIVRTEPDGTGILLSDVAIIHDHFVDVELENYFNNKPAAYCTIYKTPSQDAIQIASLVKAYVAGKTGQEFDYYGYEESLDRPWYSKPFGIIGAGTSYVANVLGGRPDPMATYREMRQQPFNHHFEIALHTDLSRFVEGRLDLMTRNGLNGLILVLISLNLFLNWRVAFWASIGLPVSFLGTFIVMWAFGVTINLLSLFGLIIVLGIIVDDAIVIGENIYRHVEEGMAPIRAAVVGAEEVMWPVTVAVITTIAAFSPLFFIQGQIGDFMGQLPLVVLAALSVSLVEALLILPAHLAHLPRLKDKDGNPIDRTPKNMGIVRRSYSKFVSGRDRFVHGVLAGLYERFLRLTLRWRYLTVTLGVCTSVLAYGLLAGGIVQDVLIQKMDSETIICNLEMPIGVRTEVVKEQISKISEFVKQAPEVVNVRMNIGRAYDIAGAGAVGSDDQSHVGQLVIELLAADAREAKDGRSSEELLNEFRKMSSNLPGVNSIVWQAISGGPGGKAIEIKIASENRDYLEPVAIRLKKELAGYAGVFDIDDDFDRGKREAQIRLLEAARPTGITVTDLGNHVRSAIYGKEAKRFSRNREDIKIMVRYPEEFRNNIYNLEAMYLPTGTNYQDRGWIPFSEVAQLEESESFTTLNRTDMKPSISVFADVKEQDGTANIADIIGEIKKTFSAEVAPEYPGTELQFLGNFEERTKSFASLRIAFPVALLLIYLCLAALFRSYFQPLVVMMAIPFGIQGAIFGHWLTDNPFTMLSRIGCVALTGIIVNDSLVLVDFINARIRAGLSEMEATISGARLRLRAILLTTLTTVAGLTPLMFETSFQAAFLIPMAVTLTFGLVFATILTLIIVPAINMIYFDFVKLGLRMAGKDVDRVADFLQEHEDKLKALDEEEPIRPVT